MKIFFYICEILDTKHITIDFMKTQLFKEYQTPEVMEQEVLCEGVLCMSGTNEDYAGVPGEDETIF